MWSPARVGWHRDLYHYGSRGRAHNLNGIYSGDFQYYTTTSANVSYTVAAATASCFRSVTSGDWNVKATWEQATTCAGPWSAATSLPSATAVGVTIRSGHTVTVDVSTTTDQTVVESGGTLIVNNNATLSLANGPGTGIDLSILGDATVESTGAIIGGDLTNLTVGATGHLVVESNGNADSTLGVSLFSGNGGNQPTFQIDGVMTIPTGGSAGGQFDSFRANGLVDVTGGNLTTYRGNGGAAGQINSGGTVAISGSGSWTINVGTGTVASGGTLTLGPTAVVNGSGGLSVAAGANLEIGSTAGITSSGATGNVQTSARTFDVGANYTYNGSAAQVTGSGLPATVNSLTIDNSGGNVTLTNVVTTVSTRAEPDPAVTSRRGGGANLLVLAAAATCNGTTDVVSDAAATGGVRRTTIGTGTTRCFGNPNNRITINSGTASSASGNAQRCRQQLTDVHSRQRDGDSALRAVHHPDRLGADARSPPERVPRTRAPTRSCEPPTVRPWRLTPQRQR